MTAQDATALAWAARVFVAIGIGAAILCGSFGLETLRFLSDSVQAEGVVVDWNQGRGSAGRSSEPGAYYRVIEVVAPDGRRLRGEAEVGVGMNELEIGERLAVRYRPSDPARMRVVSISGLWLRELVAALLAIAFGAAGMFLLKQAKNERGRR